MVVVKKQKNNQDFDVLSLLAFNIDDAWKFIKFYESKDKNGDELLKIIKKDDLIFLRKIAYSCQKDIFDKNVVEAYWLGNELLEVFWKGKLKDIPCHNLQVFFNRKNTNCLVTIGRVISVITNAHAVILEKNIVSSSNGKYVLSEEERSIVYDRKLLSLKKGDVVLLHWGMARIKLTASQEKSAISCAKKVIRIINSKKFK